MGKKVGVLWPSAENYGRFAAVCPDIKQATWDDYVAMAAPKIAQLRAQGVDMVQLDFDPDALVRWCQANGAEVNSNGRAGYAGALLAEQGRGG